MGPGHEARDDGGGSVKVRAHDEPGFLHNIWQLITDI